MDFLKKNLEEKILLLTEKSNKNETFENSEMIKDNLVIQTENLNQCIGELEKIKSKINEIKNEKKNWTCGDNEYYDLLDEFNTYKIMNFDDMPIENILKIYERTNEIERKIESFIVKKDDIKLDLKYI